MTLDEIVDEIVLYVSKLPPDDGESEYERVKREIMVEFAQRAVKEAWHREGGFGQSIRRAVPLMRKPMPSGSQG